MTKKGADKHKLMKYWEKSSDEDFETMLELYRSRHFSWSLFVGHLMIEKLMKALYVKVKGDYPPYIHNLLRLAELTGLPLDEDQTKFFATVTAFNINARYDDYKNSFKKKCTPDFTYHWKNQLEDKRQWIKQQLKK